MLSGFINLYKESGMTSNKALSILKMTLKENNISTKVGHFGTLDPLAEGVLPVALGRAARLFDYSLNKSKTYKACFLFGVSTDTLDIDGKILTQENVDITEQQVNNILQLFIGEISQIPPQYSAKSVNGVRAYKLARKGIEVKLAPKIVTIHHFILDKKVRENTFEFTITCSSGTYIRSLVRDMASAMGTVGVMTKLIRTTSGFFHIENALKVSELTDLKNNIQPLEAFTDGFDKLYLNERQKKDLVNGIFPLIEGLEDKFYTVYDKDVIMGIGEKFNGDYLRLKTWLL